MEDYYTHRNSGQRAFVLKSDDSGTENYHDIDGLEGMKPTKVMHIQPHGFSSVPAPNAHMALLNMGGRHDSMLALGGEHPDYKPKGLGAGNVALYNADGTLMKFIGKNVDLVCGHFKVTCGGDTFELTGSGITLTSSKITTQGATYLGDKGASNQVERGGSSEVSSKVYAV